VWLDAHADFNTPETTATGFFAGMSMAVVTGHCYRNYWAQLVGGKPLAEEAVVMYGIRDLSPQAEQERLERSAIHVIEWRDCEPQGDLVTPLDKLAQRVDEIYLHVDLDAFSPELAPGIVDEPAPGGMSLEQAEEIIRAAAERFRIRAITLATFAPDRDEGEKTLQLALRILELFGDYAAAV
jgi:arginase